MAVFRSFDLHSTAFPGIAPAIVCRTLRLNESGLRFFQGLAEYLTALVLPQQPGGCHRNRSSCAIAPQPPPAKFSSDAVRRHLYLSVSDGSVRKILTQPDTWKLGVLDSGSSLPGRAK